MGSRRTLIIGVAVAGVLALLVAGYWAIYASPPQSKESLVEAPERASAASLRAYLAHRRAAFEFPFRYQPGWQRTPLRPTLPGRDQRLGQNHKATAFSGMRFDASAEPARLESEISVFDNSAAGSHVEKITIELYGYRPEKSNREWIEAGIKSIHYQNLSGQCQQSRPVPLVSTSN